MAGWGWCKATDGIDPAIVRELFRYFPETGKLYRKLLDGREIIFDKGEAFFEVHSAIAANSKAHGLQTNTCQIRGAKIKVTHIAVAYMTGRWPENLVDHKRGDLNDLRWASIRIANHQQNAENKAKDYSTPARNVRYIRGKFEVKVSGVYIGRYDTFEKANFIAKKYRRILHGGFAIDARKSWRRF